MTENDKDEFIEIARKENLFLQKREKQEIYWIKKTIREEIGNKKFKEIVYSIERVSIQGHVVGQVRIY